jgi:glyoxylase-like metal-dependent hydrolase (beta-lactamase superfamily II)
MPGAIDSLMKSAFLSTEKLSLDQNLLVVNTGEKLVMFDSGTGRSKNLALKHFGDGTGRARKNLLASGIDPRNIDLVILTHAHPDHSWGLVDEQQRPLYPNARVAINTKEFEYWTDLSKVATVSDEHAKDQFRGAHFNLTPYRDNIVAAVDGKEVIPGVRAIASPGHSPGHMAYAIESGGDTIINLGDLAHHHILLFERPRMEFLFDYDPQQAVKSRLAMLDYVSKEGHQVLAYHFPFPGRGHVIRRGDGFAYVPTPIEL